MLGPNLGHEKLLKSVKLSWRGCNARSIIFLPTFTYTSVINAVARSGKNPEKSEAILDRMAQAGVHPNVVTFSAVINGTFALPAASQAL